ncbi:MAG: AMIN domain-containing protein [Proteobacteria bacterium]|nr:AMIN domain-containing protein [Pseudomonadota bacterium]NOG58986.1 AMIN domain-containing protein [Pseudomonadota bacterium]
MRFLVFYSCFFFSSLVFAGSVTVENVRVWAAPDSTRVVFDISGPVEHELSLLKEPYRTVIDLKDSSMIKDPVQPGSEDKYLQGIRAAARNNDDLRIVLDLKKFVNYKSFQLEPNKHYGHRLVVDLYSNEQKETRPVNVQEEITKANLPRDVIIAIDAGHGGEDPGAKGPSGVYEKNVVFNIAKDLVAAINKERGMKAVMIREGDYYMSLRKRIDKAREYKADLFMSIHADAFRDPKVHGSSVYVLSKKGASSEAAKWLAESENASDLIGGVSLEGKDDVLASVLLDLSQTASLEASIDIADRVLRGLKGIGKVHKRTVQSAGFAVLKSPDIPSILIETAFISNPREEKKLLSASHRKNMANAMVVGLRGYFRDFAPEGTILASRKHIIARGETLSTIAQQYRVSTNTLRQYNGLKGDLVRVGQTISIPRSSSGT